MQVFWSAVRYATACWARRWRTAITWWSAPRRGSSAPRLSSRGGVSVFPKSRRAREYALARTERKTAPGYHGFVFHAAPEVTLEDLRRRDHHHQCHGHGRRGAKVVDPSAASATSPQQRLRHVSPAFAEDPVRVLRVARFATRYAPLGFQVADGRWPSCGRWPQAGEVDHLVPSASGRSCARPWPDRSHRPFCALRDGDALPRLFPRGGRAVRRAAAAEFTRDRHRPAHRDGAGHAARLAPGDALVGWCALTHDLGKALRAAGRWPPCRPRGARRGADPRLAARLKPPTDYTDLAVLCCRLHLQAYGLRAAPGDGAGNCSSDWMRCVGPSGWRPSCWSAGRTSAVASASANRTIRRPGTCAPPTPRPLRSRRNPARRRPVRAGPRRTPARRAGARHRRPQPAPTIQTPEHGAQRRRRDSTPSRAPPPSATRSTTRTAPGNEGLQQLDQERRGQRAQGAMPAVARLRVDLRVPQHQAGEGQGVAELVALRHGADEGRRGQQRHHQHGDDEGAAEAPPGQVREEPESCRHASDAPQLPPPASGR